MPMGLGKLLVPTIEPMSWTWLFEVFIGMPCIRSGCCIRVMYNHLMAWKDFDLTTYRNVHNLAGSCNMGLWCFYGPSVWRRACMCWQFVLACHVRMPALAESGWIWS
jgi:hypothetical protein